MRSTAPPEPPTDGDAQARFDTLFESTHRGLLAYAVRRVVDPADAADVVAETYLVAWRRLADVPPGDSARPWLFSVARRVLANLHRGERRRLALADRLRATLVETVPPPDASVLDGGRSPVERALAGLSEPDQEVLRLHAWEELAHDEIALVLGLPRGAVRVRLHRARNRLAARLAALEAAEAMPVPVKRAGVTGQVIRERAAARTGVEEA